MALFGNVSADYTKTGKGGLTEFANKLSFVPFLRSIPLFGSTITAVLGYADTILESAQWLFKGKFASAATTLVAGAVGSTVNGLTDKTGLFWWANAASGVTTGVSLGTHARAMTEGLIGGVTGSLGAKPQVLSSYPAAIGSIGNAMTPQGRTSNFRDQIAAERGMTRAQMDARADQAYVNNTQSASGLGA